MSTTSTSNSTSSLSSCLEQVAKERSYLSSVAHQLRELLNSQEDSSAFHLAKAIEQSYDNDFLASDPLARFQDDRGMGQFLNALYEFLMEVACLISHDDDKQDILVQTLVELRKLPAKAYRIWNEDCLVYSKEPVFGMVFEHNWNAVNVGENDSGRPDDTAETIERRCREWANFSSFDARCIAAGLFDADSADERCRHAGVDILKGLEHAFTPGPIRNCKVLVATQYLILAGSKIYEDYLLSSENSSEEKKWGIEHWQLWKQRLQDIAARGDTAEELKAKAKEAILKMSSLEQHEAG